MRRFNNSYRIQTSVSYRRQCYIYRKQPEGNWYSYKESMLNISVPRKYLSLNQVSKHGFTLVVFASLIGFRYPPPLCSSNLRRSSFVPEQIRPYRSVENDGKENENNGTKLTVHSFTKFKIQKSFFMHCAEIH